MALTKMIFKEKLCWQSTLDRKSKTLTNQRQDERYTIPYVKNLLSVTNRIKVTDMTLSFIRQFLSGVALVANFCVNIAFSGAICILATLLHHCMQNDWTLTDWTCYGSVRLPRHSSLLANSVSSKTVQLHSWRSSIFLSLCRGVIAVRTIFV